MGGCTENRPSPAAAAAAAATAPPPPSLIALPCCLDRQPLQPTLSTTLTAVSWYPSTRATSRCGDSRASSSRRRSPPSRHSVCRCGMSASVPSAARPSPTADSRRSEGRRPVWRGGREGPLVGVTGMRQLVPGRRQAWCGGGRRGTNACPPLHLSSLATQAFRVTVSRPCRLTTCVSSAMCRPRVAPAAACLSVAGRHAPLLTSSTVSPVQLPSSSPTCRQAPRTTTRGPVSNAGFQGTGVGAWRRHEQHNQ